MGGCIEEIVNSELRIEKLARFPQAGGMCTIVYIETRPQAAILTALARVLARRSSLSCRHLPTVDWTLATRAGGAAGPGQDPQGCLRHRRAEVAAASKQVPTSPGRPACAQASTSSPVRRALDIGL